jgi:hypothetical protein
VDAGDGGWERPIRGIGGEEEALREGVVQWQWWRRWQLLNRQQSLVCRLRGSVATTADGGMAALA